MSGENGYLPEPRGFATAAIHAFQEPEQWGSMAVVAPMVASTTFKQYGPGNFKVLTYSGYQYKTTENLFFRNLNMDVLETPTETF